MRVNKSAFLQVYAYTMQIEWAHVDMAPTGWDFTNNKSTGYGVYLLTKWYGCRAGVAFDKQNTLTHFQYLYNRASSYGKE